MNSVTQSGNAGCAPAHRASAFVATATWLCLVVATLISWWMAGGGNHGTTAADSATSRGVIVALALVKMYIVVAIFMGIRRAPWSWHLSVIATLSLIGGFLAYLVTQP